MTPQSAPRATKVCAGPQKADQHFDRCHPGGAGTQLEMHFLSRFRLPIAGAVALSALVLTLGAPTTSQASTASTLTFAEMPGASPNYIFPYASCLYDSPNNIGQFQQLMFRPLYWFGVRPLTHLSKFTTHEKEFLAGLRVHVGEQQSQVGEFLPLVAGHLADQRSLAVNDFIVRERQYEILEE